MTTEKNKIDEDDEEDAVMLRAQLKAQARMRELFGKVAWEGDLEQSRQNRIPDDAWTR
jgi:hypothetical protein